jgi:hypothetical protein
MTAKSPKPAKSLPARPNLDHLRSQARTLLADLRAGKASAAKTFIAHLPAAKTLTPDRVRAAGFRLADAQSAIARKSGFDHWPGLARHVQQPIASGQTRARLRAVVATRPPARYEGGDADRCRHQQP